MGFSDVLTLSRAVIFVFIFRFYVGKAYMHMNPFFPLTHLLNSEDRQKVVLKTEVTLVII